MKKLISVLSCLMAVAMLFCACGETPAETTPAGTTPVETTTTAVTPTETTAPVTPTETTATTPEETTAPAVVCTEHQFEVSVIPAGPKTDGKKVSTCSVCGHTETEVIPATNSIKILAIGNSFSNDATEYLWDICHAAGIETVVIGNLYKGACSLDSHWGNMKADRIDYTYYENRDGVWTDQSQNISFALAREAWDIITVQQASQDTGIPSTYGNLQNILDYVNGLKLNPDARIYWHMTWAYDQPSTHANFVNYCSDQIAMYEAIVETTKTEVLTLSDIAGVIPCGTTIQNLRTSTLNGKLTRDTYHMSYNYGRYALALTWFGELTGLDPAQIDWVPSSYPEIANLLDVIREAVKNALATPFTVTPAATPGDAPIALTEDDIDFSKYEEIDWGAQMHAYYTSTSKSEIFVEGSNRATDYVYYIGSKQFTKDELPVGTVIVVDTGFMYRPDGWTALGTKTDAKARPDSVATKVVVIDEAWWGNFTVRAFNLSRLGVQITSYQAPSAELTEADIAHLRIFVPKA